MLLNVNNQQSPHHNTYLAVISLFFIVCNNTHGIEFSDTTLSSDFITSHSTNKLSCDQAIADFNNDGWQDAFVTGYFDTNHLYINNADGTFSESSLTAQSNPADSNCGPAATDYNNNGW